MGWREVRITADTNVLVRAVVRDDAARALLLRATAIAVPIPVLCELARVLRRGYGYGFRAGDIAAAIEAIADIDTVATDSPAVDAGLAVLRTGGDFADGAIASQGERLGGTVFASFDRGAAARLRSHGANAADPAELTA